MNKRNGVAALVGLFLLAASAVTANQRERVLCAGFLPENDMKIPVSLTQAATGVDEASFNAILDRIQTVYGPIVAAKGGKLFINRKWTDATVNASATQLFGNWVLNMYGGLARHPAMTEEGFALVACHELGHHLGGAPKLSGFMTWLGLGRWATNEGGADYFATLKCMRLVKPSSSAEIDATGVAACDSVYADPSSRAACRSGAAAGQSVALVFQSLKKIPQPPAFATPDRSAVSSTFDGHPEPQCRLDTYFQGALCPQPVSESVADRDPNAGACTRRQGFQVGLRPLCWYKPPADEPVGPSVASHVGAGDVQRIGERLDSLRTALEIR